MKIDLRKGKIIKIKCDECKRYLSLLAPLSELGYKEKNIIDGRKYYRGYTKNGKVYRCLNVEHFNDTILYIVLKEVVGGND